MSYRIAGIDVHKKMLAVVVADVGVQGDYQFEREPWQPGERELSHIRRGSARKFPGVSCGTNPTYYNSIFTLQGNSGSASYVLGDIITDNLAMGGSPTINMALNPTAAYSTLKATLLR